jgi:hypothetical protein
MIDLLIKHLPTIDPENIREFYEERAGVREFDGGMPRSLAERYAFEDTMAFFYLENHIKQTSNI